MVRFSKIGRGSWSIVGASTLWGTTGVATQVLYNLSGTNALTLAFLRLAIAGCVLCVFCWQLLGLRMWRMKRRDALLMLLMGVMQALFQFGYLAAIPECGVTVATLVALCVAPVIVVLYAALFMRERITVKIVLALLCALAGTVLLTGEPTGHETSGNLLLGVFLALVSAAGYAGVILAGRTLSSRCHPLQINTISFGMGAILLLAGALSTHLMLSYSMSGWLLVLYLGFIPTALAYMLFQSGLRSTSATLTSILTLCEPLTATILAWLLFGERLNVLGILGALLLFGTLLLLAQGNATDTLASA